jgi:hypothetical protein
VRKKGRKKGERPKICGRKKKERKEKDRKGAEEKRKKETSKERSNTWMLMSRRGSEFLEAQPLGLPADKW